MGGVDKGLQLFRGEPLAWHALQRLRQQQGPRLAGCMLNANRHLEHYATWQVPVLSDSVPGFAGPLAGMLAGLAHCPTPYLLTVPCDTPTFPLDLLERLAEALASSGAELAVAASRDATGQLRPQPVFCLLQRGLHDRLAHFVQNGGNKVGAWTAQQQAVLVPFERTQDATAFSNVNTLDELRALEAQTPGAA